MTFRLLPFSVNLLASHSPRGMDERGSLAFPLFARTSSSSFSSLVTPFRSFPPGFLFLFLGIFSSISIFFIFGPPFFFFPSLVSVAYYLSVCFLPWRYHPFLPSEAGMLQTWIREESLDASRASVAGWSRRSVT